AGALKLVGDEMRGLGFAGRVVVVTDSNVAPLYLELVLQSLTESGLSPREVVLDAGEEQKSLASAGRMYDTLNEVGAERGTPVVALGGGVVGDLGGFVAATYFRGVPLIHVPTTLLAQVDSSIGGKVAVNHGKLKNNVGAFHQPMAILSDTGVLGSLPEREFRNGLAEVVKSAVIRDAQFFSFLEQNVTRIMDHEDEVMEDVVATTARIKAGVVQEDERDGGVRNILNFGHTVGHGVESASEFGLSHGESVAIGMLAACRIACEMGICEAETLQRVESLLARVGLPPSVPSGVDFDEVLDAMKRDKKVSKGKLRFVLPLHIGEVAIRNDVPEELITKAVRGCYSGA
ncbi:3-dehydroquinate synthase, partial [Chloroflexota bacterium]